jgi:hypothetical protein
MLHSPHHHNCHPERASLIGDDRVPDDFVGRVEARAKALDFALDFAFDFPNEKPETKNEKPL